MKLSKFQKKVGEIFPTGDNQKLMAALWIMEEASEIIKEFKRSYKDQAELNQEAIFEEIGDLQIVTIALMNAMGIDSDQAAKAALQKWTERKND